jgi:hypothetical protein
MLTNFLLLLVVLLAFALVLKALPVLKGTNP